MTIPADLITIQHADGNISYHRGVAFGPDQPSDATGYQIGTTVVRVHGWYQRWTDRTASPLKVKDTPAQIVARNRSFAYGDIGVPIQPIPAPTFAGPMDNAGIGKYMPTGGGGSDRAHITDYSAHFMRTGDPTSMFAQAQAADSIPINFIDATTGKPIDLVATPLANTYSGGQFFPHGIKDAQGITYYADGWTPSTDHFPTLSFIAFQASHDIALLYNLQFAANFPFLEQPYTTQNSGLNPPVALILNGQTRFLAWSWRMLLEAWAATKDAEAWGILPADLLPSSYFKKLLDNNLAYFARQMQDPTRQTFRLLGPDLGHIGQWQCDYLHTAFAFGVLVGYTESTPMFLWLLGNTVARTSGNSGWPPALCAAYKFSTVPGGEDGTQPRFTWEQAFANMTQPDVEAPLTPAQQAAIILSPLKLSPLQDQTSLWGCYAVLAMADYLDKKGFAAVRKEYPEFDTCLINMTALMKSSGQIEERYSVVSIPAQTTPQPPGGIHVTKPINLVPGQTAHIPLTYDDGAGGPSQPPASITWTASPAGVVTLSNGNISGVDVKAGTTLAPFTLTADDGKGHTDSAPGAVGLPLVGAIHVNP